MFCYIAVQALCKYCQIEFQHFIIMLDKNQTSTNKYCIVGRPVWSRIIMTSKYLLFGDIMKSGAYTFKVSDLLV